MNVGPVLAARRGGNPFEIIAVREPQPRRMFGLLAMPPAERRIFSDAALQASIDAVANSLPADARAFEAEIGYDREHGVAGVAVYKTASGWSLMGGVYYNQGDFGGKVGVRKVWK